MKQEEIHRHMGAIKEKMGELELEFYVSRDYDEVADLMSEVGKPNVHPMSDVSQRELREGRAFWQFLKKDDRCIACISAKTIDLAGADFDTYFRGVAANQYGRKRKFINDISQPVIATLKGRLVYLGGIEFAPTQRGSVKILGNFTQHARLMAASIWDFDWMYTIIARRHRRLADDYGFETSFRNAVSWADPIPDGLANDQLILATSKSHYSHVLGTVDPGQL